MVLALPKSFPKREDLNKYGWLFILLKALHKNIYLFFAELKVYQALFKNERRLVLPVLYSLGAFFLLDLTPFDF